jgi:hypothetical protein
MTKEQRLQMIQRVYENMVPDPICEDVDEIELERREDDKAARMAEEMEDSKYE